MSPSDPHPPNPTTPKALPDERRGAPPWMVALFIAVLLGGGGWLVFAMNDTSHSEDCIMSGRKNCNVFPELGR